jgi:hypothetical protein
MKFLRGEIMGPVFWYLALTVGAPLAGGASSGGHSLHHAKTILLVVAVLTAARIALAYRPFARAPSTERNLHNRTLTHRVM